MTHHMSSAVVTARTGLAATLLALAATAANAQVAWLESSVWTPDFSQGNSNGAMNILSAPAGGAPDVLAEGNSMTLTGDLNYKLDPYEFNTQPDGARPQRSLLGLGGQAGRGGPAQEFYANGHFAAVALRTFRVGSLPVRWSASYTADAKIVNGFSLSETTPETSFATGMNLYFGDLSSGGLNIAVQQGELVGGGLTEFQHDGESIEYVLPANTTFTLALILEVFVTADYNGGSFFPPTTITAEFGGLSSYAGLSADVSWQTVPAPGAVVLATLAGAGLAARRRR
ncbi:MAG: hypothetical protein SFZ24_07950 [Planctomycetota bacterium]|nr:hypothetical protein [Planctomycetota bacterium]